MSVGVCNAGLTCQARRRGFANIALLIMVRHPLEQDRFELKRFRSSILMEHDLFGKPVSTFPDHALMPKTNNGDGSWLPGFATSPSSFPIRKRPQPFSSRRLA